MIELTQILSDSALRDLSENGGPLHGHLYEVFCRSQGDADVCVRARHAGIAPKGVPTRCALDIGPLRGDNPVDAHPDDHPQF